MEKCINGSDLLLLVKGMAIGHCTSHSITISPETKDRAFKPAAKNATSSSKFKNKTVTSIGVNISFEGLSYFGESETGYADLQELALAGEPVEVKSFVRGKTGASEADSAPFISGNFILSNLQLTAPADDDATYSGQLDNDGEVKGLKENYVSTEAPGA